MSSTSLELQSLELLPGDLLRPLGAFEELFCLFDQHFPTNHALAAQISGHTTVQQWRDALEAVQQRHPLLSACIDTTFNRVPHFRRVTGQRVPLRVVTSPNARWQREIAEEVNEPFTPDQAPLFRAVLLHQETHCIFILSSHHAVSDGFSLIFLLRDILLALSGHALEALPLEPSREILFGAQQRTSTEPGLPSFAAQRPPMPHVEGIKLTTEQTTALQRRAREEGVTIHAAISAALTIAGRAIDESWRNNPLRIMSPAEIRDILGLKDQCMVSFGGGEISMAPGVPTTFWELARFAKDGLSAVKSTENISRMIDLQSTAVSSNLTIEQAFQLKRNAFNAQVMFSNLGRLPFDSTFGPLKLETLWAPCALRGIEGEQILGAVTVNGSLHLTHTSPTPIPGLLAGIEEELRKACAI
ncbi:phthiocerol/phthiodiolone dimycocerosyl transferase family protein [Edaphobacter aggregans]|uniref:phthiocerol/phthiodiolone dimycocerosyl transferase family protein n=1 Tax=Edaphobacter aggregans TaxID=570835 RepID=UPI00054D4802|nr:condensation domain-containing protein [Edaphobacter aggregans]